MNKPTEKKPTTKANPYRVMDGTIVLDYANTLLRAQRAALDFKACGCEVSGIERWDGKAWVVEMKKGDRIPGGVR